MLLEELKPGLRIEGLIPAETVTLIAAQWHGTQAIELTYKTAFGDVAQQVIFSKDADRLSVTQSGSRAFNADASDYKIAAEAQRIQLAGLCDPMLAVATSVVDPLPHQISAVYKALLPRTPLRFLLADDPGAGKTIMAGLYARNCCCATTSSVVSSWRRWPRGAVAGRTVLRACADPDALLRC